MNRVIGSLIGNYDDSRRGNIGKSVKGKSPAVSVASDVLKDCQSRSGMAAGAGILFEWWNRLSVVNWLSIAYGDSILSVRHVEGDYNRRGR